MDQITPYLLQFYQLYSQLNDNNDIIRFYYLIFSYNYCFYIRAL